eukprot:COSAG05_NODE_12389_length_470_cov_0.606469_1_plen_127_part_01
MERVALAVATLVGTAHAHAGLFIPPARNADDRFLPAFQDGKSPDTPCTCANGLPTVSPPKHAEESVEVGACWTDPGMNYNSHAHNLKVVSHTPSAAACCATCSETDGCKFFTWVSSDKMCFIDTATT